MKRLVLLVLFLFLAGTTYFAGGIYYGWIGKLEQVGSIQGKIIPDKIISQRTEAQIKSSKKIGVKDGGNDYLFATTLIDDKKKILICVKI